MLFNDYLHCFLKLKRRLQQKHECLNADIEIRDIIIQHTSPIASFGEAKLGTNSHHAEDKNSFHRLIDHIQFLADIAKTQHRDNYCQKNRDNHYQRLPGNENKITRLSLSEFSLYTEKPLTLDEFHHLIDEIVIIATSLDVNTHLLLSSFAVLNTDRIIMNIALYIEGGNNCKIHLINKSCPSTVDFNYNNYELKSMVGYKNYLTLDANATSYVLGSAKDKTIHCLSYQSVFEVETAGGARYIQAIDICLDHALGRAKALVDYMIVSRQSMGQQFIPQQCDHIVTSNCVDIDENNKISRYILHVDPTEVSTRKEEMNSRLVSQINTTMTRGYDKMEAGQVNGNRRIWVYKPPFGNGFQVKVKQERQLSQFPPETHRSVEQANRKILSNMMAAYLQSNRGTHYLHNNHTIVAPYR